MTTIDSILLYVSCFAVGFSSYVYWQIGQSAKKRDAIYKEAMRLHKEAQELYQQASAMDGRSRPAINFSVDDGTAIKVNTLYEATIDGYPQLAEYADTAKVAAALAHDAFLTACGMKTVVKEIEN